MPSLRARSLMELVTVTRASTATYCGANGLLASAAAGVARIDHDPVTRAVRGLLVEEARTNLLLRSEEFDNAAWTKAGVTVVANGRLAPSGLITMDKLEEDNATSAHYTRQAYTKTSSTEVQAYAFSCWGHPAERSWLRLAAQGNSGTAHRASADFDVASGVAMTPSIAGNYDSAMAWVEPWLDATGKLIYRCCLTFRINNDGQTELGAHTLLMPSAGGGDSYLGTTGSGLYVWGAQLEKGPFPSSYIPTTTAAVVRNADDIRMASLSPWFENEAAGTIIAEYSLPWTYSALDTASRRIVEINDGTNANRHLVYVTGGRIATLTGAEGAGQAGGISARDQPARGVIGRAGWAWAKDSFARAIDGSIDLVDSAGAVPATLTTAQLGLGAGGSVLQGHLRRIRFYPRRVTNAELQQLTKAA